MSNKIQSASWRTKSKNFKKLVPRIKKNILLRNYTTFKIGGPAKYFFEANNKKDLTTVIKWAKKYNLPFFILGGGSNLLVSDKGYDGLVIKVKDLRLKIKDSEIYAAAGVKLTDLLNLSLKNSLQGLEWAAGIPGTIGGAIYGNTGILEKSVKEIIKEVEIFDLKKEKIEILKTKNCKFNYRKSIFKKNKNLIILSCILQLEKGNKEEIKEKIKKFLKKKQETQPLKFPSAGCIFKNPTSIKTAKLIEKCGLKGKRIGEAEISQKHANFIVNLGRASSEDVLKLISLIKKKIKKKFGIKLEEEIQYLGF